MSKSETKQQEEPLKAFEQPLKVYKESTPISTAGSISAAGKPVVISSEVAIEAGLYKVPLYQQLQHFGNKSKARQLLLSEFSEDEVDSEVEVTGLDLSVSEQKALSAILKLLDRTDYQGNLAPIETVTKSHGRVSLPRLSISYKDYFEAYELSKVSGRYTGRTRDEALGALESLAKEIRTVIYERKRWKGEGKNRKQVSDIIKVQAPLINLTSLTAYRDLEQPEAERVRAGEELPGKARTTRVLIEFHPLLVDSVEDFYLLKSVNFFREIEEIKGGKRYSPAIPLFLSWLATKNSQTVKIGKKRLAERLRLDYLIQQRKPKLLDKMIQDCLQTAKSLNYLLSYEEGALGVLKLSLNPKRCTRIERACLPGPEEEES